MAEEVPRWPTHRSRLTAKPRKISSTLVASSKTCTIVFPVVPDTSPGIFTITPSAQYPDGTAAVVYDHTQLVDSNNPFLLVSLDIFKYGASFDYSRPHIFPQLMCNIRVLPISSRTCVTLPPGVIRHIVNNAIDQDLSDWRPALLRYSLVCKAWNHVLDLFFQRFGFKSGTRVDARCILRALCLKPHYPGLMQSVRYHDFDFDGDIDNVEEMDWELFLDIMGCATRARRISVPSIPPQLLDRTLSTLANLYEVREGDFNMSELGHPPMMTLADILMITSKWKHLKDLAVCGPLQKWRSNYNLPDDFQYNIETLSIYNVRSLTGRQLLYVASPRLSNLRLMKVNGIRNKDFQVFLSVTAHTLREIIIHRCHFNRSPGEEYALDAVMPKMTALEKLLAIDAQSSILSVTRKPYNPRPSLRSEITLKPTKAIALENIEEAINVATWASVEIYWDHGAVDPLLVAKAERAARRNGITFRLTTR